MMGFALLNPSYGSQEWKVIYDKRGHLCEGAATDAIPGWKDRCSTMKKKRTSMGKKDIYGWESTQPGQNNDPCRSSRFGFALTASFSGAGGSADAGVSNSGESLSARLTAGETS
jgi:hypothetical protein